MTAAFLRDGGQRVARQRQHAQHLAALAPGNDEAEQRNGDEAHELHVHGKPVHGGGGGAQHHAHRADDENGHEGLHEGCGEAQNQALAERLLVRHQIGRDHALAVPRSRRVEDPISEADHEKGAERRAALLQRMHVRLEAGVEAGLDGQDPGADVAGRRGLADAHAEGAAGRGRADGADPQGEQPQGGRHDGDRRDHEA
jgi:hypothetical protein